jgi:hypothetical protein
VSHDNPFEGGPVPAEIWTVRRDGHVASCYISFDDPVTLMLVYDGTPLVTLTSLTAAEALAWAEQDREELVALGWQDDEPGEVPEHRKRV